MSDNDEKSTRKRNADPDENEEEDSNDGWIGPMPTEQSAASKPKKKKGNVVMRLKCLYFYSTTFYNVLLSVLPYEKVYLENLPDADCYEKSYMHRDVITHLVVTKTDFLITGSLDGHIKFWKKMEEGIEFVKHFRSHLSKSL